MDTLPTRVFTEIADGGGPTVDLFEAFGSWETRDGETEYQITARCRYTDRCRHRIRFSFDGEAVKKHRNFSGRLDQIYQYVRKEFDIAHSRCAGGAA